MREHSGAVAVPIDLVDKPGAEPRRVADGAAIWAKPKSEITPEEYAEFYRSLSGPIRRAGADRALARRGAARICRAGVRSRLAPVRPLRSGAQEPQQALRPARADHPGRGPAAGLAALRPAGRRQHRSAAQRLARDDPAERGLRRDPQGRDQSHGAGADQARRERAGEIRQDLGAFRRGDQGRPLRGPRAARRSVQARALRHHDPSRRRPHARRLCRRACARTRRRSII